MGACQAGAAGAAGGAGAAGAAGGGGGAARPGGAWRQDGELGMVVYTVVYSDGL